MKKIKRYSGATRDVLCIGTIAIKTPSCVEWRLFLHGLLGNMQEVLYWKRFRDRKTCPVLFAWPGGLFIVMRRAEMISTELHEDMDYEEWKNTVTDFPGLTKWTIPVEDKQDSFGLIDGKIVAVDYGS